MTIEYRCPKCQNHDNLEVVVLVTAKLIQDEDGFQTSTEDASDTSHEWNTDSLMTCGECRHEGNAIEFRGIQAVPFIRAEVHHDSHHHHEVEFNAVSWFETASNDDIIKLASNGWGGCNISDDVALSQEESNTDVRSVMKFTKIHHNSPEYKGRDGFECNVNYDDAMTWLERHRPDLYATVTENMQF